MPFGIAGAPRRIETKSAADFVAPRRTPNASEAQNEKPRTIGPCTAYVVQLASQNEDVHIYDRVLKSFGGF